ncbi:MAG: metalloregulator ArsR/SmtB family transcription factor [Ignavibacteriaceae bacterium]|nr:metalloregulator ArsR/SmtB family transcription factor [Ignavibacteriaceae bacterium]
MDITKKLEILKSLSDLSRLQVLNALMDKPAYVEELANCLNLAASTVSFHLSKLVKAGLVTKRREQYYAVYEINREITGLRLSDLIRDDSIGEVIKKERDGVFRQKVRRAFYREEKLVQIPVQRKKRLLILNELKELFSEGRSYHETEVNDILRERCADFVTIRRMLIDEGMLERDKQIYVVNKNYKPE